MIQIPDITAHPEVTVAVALAAGMLAQVAARHGRLPGIVVLLVTGLLLGPDLLGIVQPEQLGPALHGLIGFAVAVILFEGGLKLDFKRIRAQSQVIRNLLTVGALVTAAGGALAHAGCSAGAGGSRSSSAPWSSLPVPRSSHHC